MWLPLQCMRIYDEKQMFFFPSFDCFFLLLILFTVMAHGCIWARKPKSTPLYALNKYGPISQIQPEIWLERKTIEKNLYISSYHINSFVITEFISCRLHVDHFLSNYAWKNKLKKKQNPKNIKIYLNKNKK